MNTNSIYWAGVYSAVAQAIKKGVRKIYLDGFGEVWEEHEPARLRVWAFEDLEALARENGGEITELDPNLVFSRIVCNFGL